jgi:hypothetical protein
MSAQNFKKKLAAAGKKWKVARETASTGGSGWDEFEDGRYLTQVTGLEIGESQNGRLQLVWDFKFLEGDNKDKVKKDFQGMETEQNLQFVAQRITQFGYEVPEDIEDVEDVVKAILKEKPICRISLKSKGDFQNVRVLKVLGKDEADAAGEDAEESESEEISDDGTEIKKGMKITCTIKGKEVTAEVVEVLEDEGKIRIVTDEGKKYAIASDKVTGIVEEEDTDNDEEEESEEEESEDEEESDEDEIPEEPTEDEDDDEEDENEEEDEDDEDEKPVKKSKVVKKTSSLKRAKKKK